VTASGPLSRGCSHPQPLSRLRDPLPTSPSRLHEGLTRLFAPSPRDLGNGSLRRGRGATEAIIYGFNTTLIQSSCLFLNVSYISGASSRRMRWVMTKLGSISPFCTRSSNGAM